MAPLSAADVATFLATGLATVRRFSDLYGNCRAMSRSPKGWGMTTIHHGTIQGGPNEKVPSALAGLAAAESSLIFWLVKLSGCREGDQDERH